MLRIGLTGGIGSGKTTVAKIFEVLGVPVYYADDAAKKLMNENRQIIDAITTSFGRNSYVDGQLNRPYISSIVFSDSEKLRLLNSIVHPVTIADAEAFMYRQQSPYVIKEAALMFESDAYKQLDKIIGVSAPEEIRLQRSMQRDGSTREEVLARMSKQMNEVEKMKRCDFVLLNNEQELLIPQVVNLHRLLLEKAN